MDRKRVCYKGEYIKAKDTGLYYKVTNPITWDNRVYALDLIRNKNVLIPNELVIRLDRQERKSVELLYG